MTFNGLFGSWLSQRRKALDLTQMALANQVSCSVMTIRKIERDIRRPSRQIAEKLADVLAISLDERAAFVAFARRSGGAGGSMPAQTTSATVLHNLPLQPTHFVGREIELAQIGERLADPNCRLLTLVGPGGIGKTRLAIEAVGHVQESLTDRIVFVSLQAISDSQLLVPCIVSALGMLLMGVDDPRQQLLGYLRDCRMLLLLDNFEQVIDGIDLLVDLLKAAPGVKLLVTSREALNVRGEWLYVVTGLAFPKDERAADAERYDAVQLFVERAQRVRHDFSLGSDPAHVIEVCRRVEGMPLALEMAAGWTKTLSCADIAAEIKRGLEILASNLRDVPERHHSMQAVFAHSWNSLTEAERTVFRRLSVFRGGFLRDAAERVAQATLLTLAALVDRSFLRVDETGRYSVHELLRQYAHEQLEQDTEEENRVKDAHCAYYAEFLEAREEGITGGRQRGVIQEVAANIENIRAAWLWAIRKVSIPNFHKAAYTLYEFCDFRGRYQEATDLLEQAIECLETADISTERDTTLGLLLVLVGWIHIHRGQYQKANLVFSRSSSIFGKLKMAPPPGFGTDPLTGLGLLATVLGDYQEAIRLSKVAIEENSARGDKRSLQIAYYVMASAAYSKGDYEAARQNAQHAYILTRDANNHWMTANVLIVLGDVAGAVGDYDQAWQHYQDCYAMKQELDDPAGMASALANLGEIAWLQQAYAESEKLFKQSHEFCREINNPGGQAKSLCGLGDTALALGDYRAACSYFCQGLKIGSEILWMPLLLTQFAAIGELLYRTGDVELAVELWAVVIHHSASERLAKTRAQHNYTMAGSALPPQMFANAAERGKTADPYPIALAVQERLAVTAEKPDLILSQPRPAPHTAMQPLIEPLSERELEILRLLAQGLTNQEIADRFCLVLGTVKAHNHHIFGKLGVTNRVQAIARVRELNLL